MERTNANASSHTCLPLGFGMVSMKGRSVPLALGLPC